MSRRRIRADIRPDDLRQPWLLRFKLKVNALIARLAFVAMIFFGPLALRYGNDPWGVLFISAGITMGIFAAASLGQD